MIPKEPVDAVITWVDGYDATHQAKLATYLIKHKLSRSASAAPTRYNQQGEIDYCVYSILKFAPWIRTIYIVTDQQKPSIFERLQSSPYANKLKLIDHQHIFRGYENYLPTFNSLSIASMLWRIGGLSNQFICFCDDFSLIRPVQYEDFFKDDKLVLRGKWKTHYQQSWHRKWRRKYLPFSKKNRVTKPNDHRQVQENAALLAGFSQRLFYVPHVPFPLLKDKLAHFFTQYPNCLINNISHPFRHRDQFEIITLAHHLAITDKKAIIDNQYFEVTVNPAHHSASKIKKKLTHASNDECVKFFCMQSIDEASEELRNDLFNWLDCRIIEKDSLARVIVDQ